MKIQAKLHLRYGNCQSSHHLSLVSTPAQEATLQAQREATAVCTMPLWSNGVPPGSGTTTLSFAGNVVI